jgi:hypothetical protein
MVVLASVYGYWSWLRQWVGRLMPEYADDRLVFKLSSEDAVELDKLGEGFAGLAREFSRHLGSAGIDSAVPQAKLFVTDIRTGSIQFEIATVAGTLLAIHAAVDGFTVWADFYDRIKGGLEYLANRAPRPEKFDSVEAQNLDAFLNTVAGKRGANINVRRAHYHHKSGNRETVAEFHFTEQDVANAQMTLARELPALESPPKLLEAPKSAGVEYSVPFVWHRTDREKGKASGQTSDRGIVAKITDKPLPVYFASEIDNHKDQMTKTEHNPFDLVYLVDVAVTKADDGEPKSYTILNIHKIIGGGS